jgi:hypothetical protein
MIFGHILIEDADNPHYCHGMHLDEEIIMEGMSEAMEGILGLGCFLLGIIFLFIGIFLICKIL